ncbi:monovalent cation:proton antiporter-2 (CPA2) family protein [Fulvimarina sp. 2208YS6-2-32]|uniref:Monovalent cation:proton antiporter-2 (CPA2) family protein n=1 Tax=Fulvimarina uroteuthidis TaxID=3098149 RepID=A0ABU5I1T4_9HYPH|nr:monovalent cation:proton antiporter-2 (CPA2) family protein [Fulvimarina sp. 2208YS6-2-32]MDY8109333.1 monovalent cation:proton antiporter-2 (CPA2) family protein [Fulvimarina sp. 2208YS6-2-32]
MEHANTQFLEIVLLLGGGIVAGTLFKRIGLGTVLGYLAAGIAMGPLLGLIRDGEKILHIGELGVVFLLFIIGLELKLSRLWALRRQIFGLGAAQVIVTGALIGSAAFLMGFSVPAALVIGSGLALSSTAFGLQILEEQGETNTRHGQAAFSVLLFQDLAVVPILAMIPFLAPYSSDTEISLAQIAISAAAVVGLIVGGRFLLNPLFRIMASAGAREVMLGAALFVVLGSAMLMAAAGFSMAMGAFIAGVLLAESSYRHELEANIEPFRGLLLGLFFIGVGLSIDLDVLASDWLVILLAAPMMMATKAALLYGLSRIFGEGHESALRVSALLSQAGEFGFVIFSAAAADRVFSAEVSSLLIAITTLSMALTPLSTYLATLAISRGEDEDEEQMDEDFAGAGSDVLLIGFSRFGQIVAQVLLSSGRDVTILDSSAERIRTATNFGFRIFFGSGMRKDVLEAAGIRRAKLVAICTNKQETTNRIVDLIREEFPNVKLYVRAYDRVHALALRARGVDYEIRETAESALAFGGATLTSLGVEETLSRRIVDDVRRRDAQRLKLQESEGYSAGADMMVTRAVQPEPLVEPHAALQAVENAGDGSERLGEVIDETAPLRRRRGRPFQGRRLSFRKKAER